MKVGLFFGSFNPIHVGHQIIANYLVQNSDLDQVWLVVSPHNPHKEKTGLLADHHRLRLVQEAIEDNPMLSVSDIEFKMPQPSYTVDTLTYLKEKYPDHEFNLIMGEDNLRSFHKWKNYEYILENHKLIVYPRARTEQEEPAKKGLITTVHPQVAMVNAPLMHISSSLIRRQIKEGKDVRYLLTEPVLKYVDEMNFYR